MEVVGAENSDNKKTEGKTPIMNQQDEDSAAAVTDNKNNIGEEKKPESETPDSKNAKNPEDDDDGTVDTESADEEKGASSLKDPTTLMMRAVSHKEEGNNAFKNGDFNGATRAYRKGTNLIKCLNESNTGDEQVKALLINLQTNLSMSCLKQNKPRLSRDVATKALAIQEDHVKALFRRATAHRALGDLDLAKKDLKRALQKDPVNRDCKRSLISIQREIDQRHEKQKQALSRAFSSKSGSSFLYDDKEQELLRKKKEKEEMKKQKEIEKQKRKKIWEDECVKMMVDNPDAKPPSFEDWDKEKQKEEKAKKKKRDEEAKKRRQEAKPKPTHKKQVSKKDESDDDDDQLTESELRMMRGYKKTSDGRTTSYFNREQTEEEKKLLGSIAPQRLETPQRLDSTNSSHSTISASKWNSAGTWEERDTTEWCKKALESHLMTAVTKHSSNLIAVVKEVKDLTGDASVAVVSRGKSYVFDFHCKLKYEIKNEEGEKVASGTFSLPDISSTSINKKDVSDLDIEIMGWKKVPQDIHLTNSCECRQQLLKVVKSCVLSFVEEFNSQY